VVALLLGALGYESGWLIRLVALAVMLKLSFCEFALRRTRAPTRRGLARMTPRKRCGQDSAGFSDPGRDGDSRQCFARVKLRKR